MLIDVDNTMPSSPTPDTNASVATGTKLAPSRVIGIDVHTRKTHKKERPVL